QSFVAGLDGDARTESLALVRAILALAGTIGIETIAEGVETPRQQEVPLQLGCRHGQGFLYGRPKPADDGQEGACGPASAAAGHDGLTALQRESGHPGRRDRAMSARRPSMLHTAILRGFAVLAACVMLPVACARLPAAPPTEDDAMAARRGRMVEQDIAA